MCEHMGKMGSDIKISGYDFLLRNWRKKRVVSLVGTRWVCLVQFGKEDPLFNTSLRQLLREPFRQASLLSGLSFVTNSRIMLWMPLGRQ